MAWTTDDVAAVQAAIREIVAGKRVVTVNFSGGGGTASRSVTYQAAQLDELRSLLSEMQRSASGASGFRRVLFRKGFDS